MALLDVVFRILNKAGDGFIEPRKEDGHGSSTSNPSYVADDYSTGEILPDQIGANNVLTFIFSSNIQNIWVYAADVTDPTSSGEVRVDPFGGTPSSSFGIPVAFGGGFPIPFTGQQVKIFAPNNTRVTVYGNRRG